MTRDFEPRRLATAGWRGACGSALIAVLLAGSAAVGCGTDRATAQSATFPPPAVSGQAPQSYAAAVERVAPAVVTIRSERRARAPRQHPFLNDPFFREFFGDRFGNSTPQPRIERGLGSGVIVNRDGFVLTNHHVVDGASEIEVELSDRRTFTAKVVGSDPPSDLAVLRIEGSALPFMPLGNSDRTRVGDVVLAVGNPLGVGQTVTSGIISAKGRATGLSDGSFEDFIQTDASINRGNSGGALVNTNGEWIGINSQILSPSGGSIGIGFAIPSNMARTVMEELVRTGHVRRAQLAVGIQPVTAEIASSLGLKDATGVIVNAVVPGGPADKAGVKTGDVIVAFQGRPVSDGNDLRNRVASTAPGTRATVTVVREGRRMEIPVVLAELKSEGVAAEPATGGGQPQGGALGIGVEPLTSDIASQLGLAQSVKGLVVTGVDPEGPAAEAGLERGDVIEQIDRKPVRTTGELRSAVARAGSKPVLLLLNRRGQNFFATVQPTSTRRPS